jgi:hypothetical protein
MVETEPTFCACPRVFAAQVQRVHVAFGITLLRMFETFTVWQKLQL